MMQGFPRLRDASGALSGYSRIRDSVGVPLGLPNGSRRLDRSHPLALGLVGWWPLDEGQGIVARDLSTYSNKGTLTSMADPATATSGWGGGASQRELEFDGSNDIVTAPHGSQLALTGNMSACVWFRTTSAANYRSLLIKGNVGAGYPSPIHVTVESGSGSMFAFWGNGSSQAGIYTAAPLTMGLWYFAVVTRSGSTATLYINGQYNNSGSLGAQAVTDSGTALGIGGRTPGTSYNQLGSINHVRLYNRALTAVEVAQIYADKWIGAV